MAGKNSKKIKVDFKQAMGLIFPYVRERIMEQIKSVALIILYLIFFQTMVLGIPVAQASTIAVGLSLVVVGLTFFMEGLLLGLMPLGEVIGIKLPQKSNLAVILVFAFILGLMATYAEPAIGVLKEAGSSVKAWNAPLLYHLLNNHAGTLVISVGCGVGLAVVFGMLRFLYHWSLKPFLYILVSLLTVVTIWGYFQPNILHLTGLAWDCGAVTTGPVTVPLVLALGIGISRIVGGGESGGGGGFGVVTLASLFPIVTVLGLGIFFMFQVPNPAQPEEFFGKANREKAVVLFTDKAAMEGYALKNSNFNIQPATTQPIQALFDGDDSKIVAFLTKLKTDASYRDKALGKDSKEQLEKWAALKGAASHRAAFFENNDQLKAAVAKYSGSGTGALNVFDLLNRNSIAAVRAIIPLTIVLLFFLVMIIREKLPRPDEILLGVFFALIGMGIFNIGIELGLTKLGNQVGSKLPSSFTAIELKEKKQSITNFDPGKVQTAVTETGKTERFFYLKDGADYKTVPFEKRDYDDSTRQYTYTPTRGPLFGKTMGLTGILVVLLFAFIMGYGATLAEPALNALGLTVEELTVGTFKKVLLMQAVAIGVGIGIALGVAKIIWNIPLVFMLAPPYALLMFVSWKSTEEFVNIGWDSAGVTTDPITVPLVLAMGLGIGGQVPGVVEGFGILSMASVCPILSVLLVGLRVTKKRKAALEEAASKPEEKVAA